LKRGSHGLGEYISVVEPCLTCEALRLIPSTAKRKVEIGAQVRNTFCAMVNWGLEILYGSWGWELELKV
jgi:hypothetical protein